MTFKYLNLSSVLFSACRVRLPAQVPPLRPPRIFLQRRPLLPPWSSQGRADAFGPRHHALPRRNVAKGDEDGQGYRRAAGEGVTYLVSSLQFKWHICRSQCHDFRLCGFFPAKYFAIFAIHKISKNKIRNQPAILSETANASFPSFP